MNELRDTVEFDVCLEDETRVGSMFALALPAPGDKIRIDEPGEQPVYEVVRRLFEPRNITIYVRPAGMGSEQAQSPFSRQEPGAGGFT
jgi:hypothetical protein